MGTYQSTDMHVTVPATRIAELAQALRKEFIDIDNGGWGNFTTGWTDVELVGRFLPLTEGNESQYDEESHTIEESGDLVISGGFYGKVSWDLEEVENMYAAHGAHGIIDTMCEESPMRVRLTRNGDVLRIGGVIEYPGDVDEAL
jgi:hypothetical protein